MSEGTAASRSKLGLWLGAFAGFYRPGAEEIRGLDAVSKFLYSARSVILVISAQAAIIAGLLALAASMRSPSSWCSPVSSPRT
jgi:1,4-dihydroxy-2-naphthoate octaprenyltransferase